MRNNARSRLAALVFVPLVAALVAPAGSAGAAGDTPAATVALGDSAATAAGSCWEIKQQRPSAADGAYWLLTPAMTEPAQFYCDQTTDGGGWVLVGKGRNGWSTDYDGLKADQNLLTPAYAGGADAHQLSSQAIDQLLDNGRVDALADGIRLRRATNITGTSWQEVRMKLSGADRWAWSFDAKRPLASYSFDGNSRNGGTTNAFGIDSTLRWVDTTTRSVTGWNNGFGYGAKAVGSSAADSYLYSPTNGGNALPVTQVYLRPRVLSTQGFSTIPDSGTAPIAQPKEVASLADSLNWGVTGLASTPSWEGDVEVQAFTQSGDRMYVGGNFRYVTADNGTEYVQPYLAAFDVNTGNWISSFRPTFDQQVRSLATLPDGRIVVGGMFSRANGQPASGIVALDPVTGATSPSWSVQIENRITGGVVAVRSMKVVGDYLYLGGNFTHFKSADQNGWTYMRNLARVSVKDGTPSAGWNPELNGSVLDVDANADDSQVYAAGFFTAAANGVTARRAVAVPTAGTGALANPAWNPTWSSSNDYQQAIASTPGRIWVGGSEHSLFSFSPTTFARLSTSINDAHGDMQAIGVDGGVVYAGCHCDANSNTYSGATTWPLGNSTFTEADTMNWIGAFDASTGARIPGFTPHMTMRGGAGVWAITTDSNGRLWVGGDLVIASSARAAKDPSGGFARFSPRDVTPPDSPTSLRVLSQDSASVTLGWGASSDPSGVRYEILRDDRPIAATTATSITVPLDGDSRYFVRAIDGAGNVSASTPALPVQKVSVTELVASDATWKWWYQSTPVGADWAQPSFDDSGWKSGGAVLGWGTGSVVTGIDTFATTQDRPLTAYFRRTVTIADPSTLGSVKLTAVANDGAAIYVNGVEVARQNLPSGPLTSSTYAVTARREAVAKADPIVVDVPLGLLKPGANVIAAETHVNYRATPDVTFELQALATSRE